MSADQQCCKIPAPIPESFAAMVALSFARRRELPNSVLKTGTYALNPCVCLVFFALRRKMLALTFFLAALPIFISLLANQQAEISGGLHAFEESEQVCAYVRGQCGGLDRRRPRPAANQ